MKAIIMAGGEGTRLRPLTCDCPKPMMRLMDKPVMEYALRLLTRHGVREAAVTLGYLPDRITDYFGDGSDFGVSLRYYTEKEPLGTAGGVKKASEFLDETFCVLSGDGVTDISLAAALDFHKKKHALATMVLTKVPNPTAYGLVLTDSDGKITSFVEKPDWGGVVSDTVNTGIYILEPEVLSLIPDGAYDFGRELFPKMAREGAALYGCVAEGYWCDIGDIEAYLRVCRDALDKKIDIDGLYPQVKSARIAAGAVVEEPCYIGEGAEINSGAKVGAYSVIGENARLSEYSSAKRAVLWQGASLGAHASARGCVLARGAALGEASSAFECAVIGAGAETGAGCEIPQGVSVWPSKKIGERVRADNNVVWGALEAACFRSGAIKVSDPAAATRAAQAYAAKTRPRDVLLAREPSAVSAAMWHGCAAGLIAQGARVYDAGVCTLPQLRYAVRLMKTDGALLAGADTLTPLTREGCMIPLSEQRGICALMSRQDYPRAFHGISHPVAASGRSEHAYIAHLASACTAKEPLKVAVHSQSQYLLSLAEQAFSRAGARVRCEWEEEQMELEEGEIGIWLISGGEDMRLSFEDIRFDDTQTELLRAWTALENGEKRLVRTIRGAGAAHELAKTYGAETICGASVPESEAMMASENAEQLFLARDGIYFAMRALSAFSKASISPAEWLSSMPKITRRVRSVPLSDINRGGALRRLRETMPELRFEDGLCITRDNARAWITPDESKSECLIISESADAEIADELCDFCEKSLNTAIKETS